MNLSHHSKGVLLTAMGVIALSPDGLLTRLITADALTIMFWRGLFYSFGMLVLLAIYFRKGLMDAFFDIGIPGLWIAVLYFFGNLGFIYSVTNTAVANTLFILATTPFWAALIAWFIFRERVAKRTWFAILVAGLGVAIICTGESIMPNAWLGNLAGLFAASTLAASFTIVARNRHRNLLPGLVIGGFLSALILEPWVIPSTTTNSDLGYLLFQYAS